MRETRHEINEINEQLAVRPIADDRASWSVECGPVRVELHFHAGASDGPPNGLTNEVLLAIVLGRLEAWQDGTDKSRENALAITKLEEALLWLGARAKRLGEAP